MDPFVEILSALTEQIKKNEAEARKPVNHTFHSEEEAFAYYRRLASLKPGDLVTYNTTHGQQRGIYFKLTEHAQPVVFGWENGNHTATGLSPLCIVFTDEIYDVDESDIEEFHRT